MSRRPNRVNDCCGAARTDEKYKTIAKLDKVSALTLHTIKAPFQLSRTTLTEVFPSHHENCCNKGKAKRKKEITGQRKWRETDTHVTNRKTFQMSPLSS